MIKKKYIKPQIKELALESSNGFLAGSITNVKIQPGKVEVQPFEDGFANEGGFKDINFD